MINRYFHKKIVETIIKDSFDSILDAHYARLTTGAENRPLTKEEVSHWKKKTIDQVVNRIVDYTPGCG